jgi:DNA repair protein SbcC/Rad50
MLNKINIKNCYTHKDTTIEFDTGLTRLYGRNEAGKSLVFEMIRYALFGTKALRSSAKSYKNTEVTLDFTVKGEKYSVYRGPKDVTLSKDDEIIVRQTTPVNARIIELLGYGLYTFDNVNNVPQDNIGKLTKMDSKERKKFLDQLVRVSQIDDLISEYDGEVKLGTAEVNALKSGIYQVEKPEKPAGYRSSELIEQDIRSVNEDLRALEAMQTRHKTLLGQAQSHIVLPDPHPELGVEELEAALDKQDERKNVHQSVVSLYSSGLAIPDYAKLVDTARVLRDLEKLQKPKLTRVEIEAVKAKRVEAEKWDQLQILRTQLAAMEECPRCGLSFENEKGPIVQQINELEPHARPHRGLVSNEYLEEVEAQWDAWEKRVEPEEPYTTLLRYTGKEVTFTLDQYESGMKLLKELEGVPTPKVISQSLASKQKAKDRAKCLEEASKLDFSELEPTRTKLNDLVQLKHLALSYESQLQSWQKIEQKNAELQIKIEAAETSVAEKKQLVKALQDFKYYINTYFLPLVAKSASSMLKTMTNGVRNRVVISDKFDITVDGQDVETLSGSATALVNISLRLALQSVLTKNTFSVFMGDEIDASMDSDRAVYLAECLNNMTDIISQIIVISHREIPTDNEIKL